MKEKDIDNFASTGRLKITLTTGEELVGFLRKIKLSYYDVRYAVLPFPNISKEEAINLTNFSAHYPTEIVKVTPDPVLLIIFEESVIEHIKKVSNIASDDVLWTLDDQDELLTISLKGKLPKKAFKEVYVGSRTAKGNYFDFKAKVVLVTPYEDKFILELSDLHEMKRYPDVNFIEGGISYKEGWVVL